MYYTQQYEVGCHDVDPNNNLKPTVLSRFLQETANRQMRDRKPSYYDLYFEGYAFIVTRISIEVYENLHQFENIEVGTWSCGGKGATFIRCYYIKRGDTIVAKAYSEWAVVNWKEDRICKVKDIDISSYEQDETNDLDIPKKFRFPKDLEFRKVGTHRVNYSDIDMNGHMTNTVYLDMLWNFIPEVSSYEVTSVNVRYMHEAHYQAEQEILMAELPADFTGDPRADTAYGFKSVLSGGVNVEAVFGLQKTKQQVQL